MARSKPVPTGHDQHYSEWHWRPIWDVQHYHETQTQGEQFQGLYTLKHAEAQPSLYIVFECFIIWPWALGVHTQPQSDVLHILYSLGCWSHKVGARAALRLPPTQGFSSYTSEKLFSLDIHVICIPHLSPLKNSLVAGGQCCTFVMLSVACHTIFSM